MAYVDTASADNWIARVDNHLRKAVTFTAVDKCVMKDDEARGKGRCDCMLTTETGLYLVELKERESPGWQAEAKRQLVSTIELLQAHHDVSQYRHKKAFACNKKHRRPFVVVSHDEQRAFFREYGFRLDVQTTVLIVS